MVRIYQPGLTCGESIHERSNKTIARNQSPDIISSGIRRTDCPTVRRHRTRLTSSASVKQSHPKPQLHRTGTPVRRWCSCPARARRTRKRSAPIHCLTHASAPVGWFKSRGCARKRLHRCDMFMSKSNNRQNAGKSRGVSEYHAVLVATLPPGAATSHQYISPCDVLPSICLRKEESPLSRLRNTAPATWSAIWSPADIAESMWLTVTIGGKKPP